MSKPKPKPSKYYSLKLDDLTHTRIEWLKEFSKHLSVPAPSDRMVISRAIEFYIEYMEEELRVTHACKPKAKDVNKERELLIQASAERPSIWGSPSLPPIEWEELPMFPSYKALVDSLLKDPPKPLPKFVYIYGKRLPTTPLQEHEKRTQPVSVPKRKPNPNRVKPFDSLKKLKERKA